MAGHHPVNPEKEAYVRASAQVMGHGNALLGEDLDYIAEQYDLVPSSATRNMVVSKTGRKIAEASNVEAEFVVRNGHRIYYDGSLAPEEITNLQQVQQKVDQMAQARVAASVQARANNRQNL